MPEKEYRRLTRTRSRSGFAVAYGSRSSLWLGKDHLLCVDTNGYTETYKRFHFRDIQVISIHRTERHLWLAGILGFLAFIFVILAISAAPNSPFAQWDGGEIFGECLVSGMAALCLLLLLINFLAGPACKCLLRTAVQIEDLSPLNRVRRARKALARLRPLIVAVQGEMSPEEISSRMQAVPGSLPAGTQAPGESKSEMPPVIS